MMQWNIRALALALGLACMAGISIAAPMAVPGVPSAGSNAKIEAILSAWQVVPVSQGSDVARWRDMMRIQLKLASPATLESLYNMGAPADVQMARHQFAGFMNVLGADIGQRVKAQYAGQSRAAQAVQSGSADSTRAARAVVSAKAEAPLQIGSPDFDLTYTPITPCRIVDTRWVGGVYGNFTTRNWYFYTTTNAWDWFPIQGGVYGAGVNACPETLISVSTPGAAVLTITVVGQGGAGNLIVWGGENPVASASTMSYPALGDTSTLATIPWGGRTGSGAGGSVKDFGVMVNAPTTTHVVVDVVGYFMEPQPTPLQCVAGADGVANVNANNRNYNVPAGACPTGYTLTSVSCQASGDFFALKQSGFGVYASGGANCFGRYDGTLTATDAATVTAQPWCCRVPGR